MVLNGIESFNDYIVYVDESGDNGLNFIDPDYPILILAFCVFEKNIYINKVSSEIKKFKFKYFGHDMVILHESKIRYATHDFTFLINKTLREEFHEDLNVLVENAPFHLIVTAINKILLKEKYNKQTNPYNLALLFGLEKVYSFLKEKNLNISPLHIIFESRGKKEDQDLELEFRRICNGANQLKKVLPFNIVFGDKRSNSCGLQLADLIARPVGRYLLNPNQENRAFSIIDKKIYKGQKGKKEANGLIYFPSINKRKAPVFTKALTPTGIPQPT